MLPVLVVMLLSAMFAMPITQSTFTASVGTGGNTFSSATLAAPTGLTAAKICTPLATAATPVYQAKTTASGSGGSATLAVPAGTTEGDLLIAQVALPVDGATNRITASGVPDGWAFVRRDRSNLPSYAAASELLFRIADAGEPANYTFAFTNSGAYAGAMLRISGADTRSPFEAHAGITAASSTSVAAPTVTTVTSNVLLLQIAAIRANTAFTAPGTMTEINDFAYATGPLTLHAATQNFATAGATGTRTATAGSAGVYAAALVAIRPTAVNAAPLHTSFDPRSSSDGASISFSRTDGLSTGDLLVMTAGWRGPTTQRPSVPAGWTQVRIDANGTIESIGWWYRVATSTETWPLVISPGAAIPMTASLTRVTHADTSNPIAGSGVSTGTGTVLTAPAVTVARNHTLVMHYLANDDPSGQVQYSPGPSADAYNAGTYGSLEFKSARDHAIATSTTAASSTWNAENSRPWIASTLVINPAADPYTITAKLSWTATASTWATGYTWERWTAALQQTGTVSGRATTTATDTDSLTSGTTYTYKLKTTYNNNWHSSQATTTVTPTCP